MVDNNKKVISPNVSELPSTPDMTNNNITYIQNIFKSKLVEQYNKDYKEVKKNLKNKSSENFKSNNN